MKNTWEVLDTYRNWTSLPIILKGIQNVQDARLAVTHNVPAIILSNHGGRNLDGSPSSLEIALEIYQNDPSIFDEIEVLADGGVRYGTDALRLLALGVKAVGLGRPFMYANVFGAGGVAKVASLMKDGLMNDAANLGLVRILFFLFFFLAAVCEMMLAVFSSSLLYPVSVPRFPRLA